MSDISVYITEKKENKILKRVEAECIINYGQETPSRNDIKKGISKALVARQELTVINRIKPVYGLKQLIVSVNAYEDTEGIKIEPEYKMRRDSKKVEEKAGGKTEKKKEEVRTKN